jgi:hypothetical protein
MEFDRAKGTDAGVGDICSVEVGSDIGGRSIPLCSSGTAGPLSTLDRPKNDSLLFSFGGVGVLDLEGNPQDFILFPFSSGDGCNGVGGMIVGLGGGNRFWNAWEGRTGWKAFAVDWNCDSRS